MKHKRTIILILLMLCLTLTGCFGKKGSQKTDDPSSVPEVVDTNPADGSTDSSEQESEDHSDNSENEAETVPDLEITDELTIPVDEGEAVGGI